MKSVKDIEQIIGKDIDYDGEALNVSHYSQDGMMMTIHTDKGQRSFLKTNLDKELAKMEVVNKIMNLDLPRSGPDSNHEKQLMKKTTEYDMFGLISSNRKVDKNHVKSLVSVISANNLLHLNPIIVDGNNCVVDGQHRLEAARQMKVPVYYITDHGVNKTDIAALNSNKKNWSLIDYINFHTQENKTGFKRLQNFLRLYPDMPVSSALVLLSANGRRDTQAIREGFVDVDNVDQAEEIAEFLIWVSKYYDSAYVGGSVQAVRAMFNADGFDLEYFKQKIVGQPRSLVKCINKKQYQEMFLDIYNYKLSTNRLAI